MSDREKLIELLVDAFCDSDDNYGCPNTGQVADRLIANGVVVREKGEWQWYVEPRGYFTAYDEDFGYRCPKCEVYAREWGADDDIFEEPPVHIHFCPNCGAKMDGGNEDDL